jgi:hypothetical protein
MSGLAPSSKLVEDAGGKASAQEDVLVAIPAVWDGLEVLENCPRPCPHHHQQAARQAGLELDKALSRVSALGAVITTPPTMKLPCV